MGYKWTITKDLVECGESEGVMNMYPRLNETLADVEVSAEGARTMSKLSNTKWDYVLWKAYDDDGEMLYRGKMILDQNSDGFEPLDDFCLPNAGATSLKICEKGKWSWL